MASASAVQASKRGPRDRCPLTIAECAVVEELKGLHLPLQDSDTGIDSFVKRRAEGYVSVVLANEGALVLIGEQLKTSIHSTGSVVGCEGAGVKG